jgi:hypothetical protein
MRSLSGVAVGQSCQWLLSEEIRGEGRSGRVYGSVLTALQRCKPGTA